MRWLEPSRTRPKQPQLEGAAERLERWRDETVADELQAVEERPDAYDANYSGFWWSTPAHADITTTSRQLGKLPAVQLDLVEDSLGWDAARVAKAQIKPDPRVLEIRAPSDWINLVDTYPLGVDRSRRHGLTDSLDNLTTPRRWRRTDNDDNQSWVPGTTAA